ncbi:MAG: D-3-phosphoglycerate dehydrogenase [Myxococcales bacterium]|nr:D-3-phosphoglycerate dehydrogenase [Myxococcales bacterium]
MTARFESAAVVVPDHWIGVERCDLAEADALVCLLLDRIDASVIARAPKLRVVANCAVGYDNVDVDALTSAGIALTNTPDVLTEATAELAFALMLAAARRLPEGEALVRSGTWQGWRLDQLLGIQLLGKTLGIIGLGRIGQAMRRRAEAFGMRVIFADPHAPGALSIDQVFAQADVVSLHCPLTPETRNLVNAERLAAMKSTAIVVNTSRGACVDEDALVDALTGGRIFAAALDVFAREPEIAVRLRSCPRLVLAPHIGSATTEARTQMAQLCADGVIAVLSGSRPRNLVNAEVVFRG